VVLPLIGTTAVATLLSAVLPHATNLSDRMVNAASATAVIVGVPEKALADEGGTLKPVMFSPVLIREGIAPSPKDAAPVLPVIETVRTVPIQLGRPPAPDTSTPFANESPELTAVSPPAPTTPSLDREGLTLLTAVPPASAPMTPVPRAQEIAPAAPQAPEPPAAAPMPRRAPQIATSYEHAPPKAPKQARKRPPRSDTKTASRTRPAQWETQRQGLRTAPPPAEEPSTMSKLVKSLWPFSSKDGSTATSKSNLGAKAPDAPGPASAPAPARSKDTFWWHEREAGR